MAVGALFEDKNKSGWYEAGEGIGGAQIEFKNIASGAVVTTSSLTAGGYQVVLPTGTYSVKASGGNLKHAVMIPSVTVGTSNVWQNIVYDPQPFHRTRWSPTTQQQPPTMWVDETKRSVHCQSMQVILTIFKFTPEGTGPATFNLRLLKPMVTSICVC